MRILARLSAAAAAALALAGVARADDMDLALSRLRVPVGPTCAAVTENGNPRDFCANDEAWGRLVAQLAGASAPPVLSPARTTGPRGFAVSADGWVTGIASDQDYWAVGTEGDEQSGADGRNRFPASALMWSRLSLRKGFPFGIELGTSLAHLLGTELWALGLELKVAIFEGYRTGVGVLPDVAVRGMVQTVTGDPEFNLTVPSVDLLISKPLVLGGEVILSPFASAQLAWTIADSELVDLTPDVDAFDECRPEPSSAATRCTRNPDDLAATGREPGQDLSNNVVFRQIRATRTRAALGAQVRYRAFTAAGSFAIDVMGPGDAANGVPDDAPSQWTAAFSVGLSY